jgi:glycosyltransferase involved in cell wall biosynthesis
LSVAHAAAALSRARVLLLTYGIEVWQPGNRLTQLLLSRTDAVASISEFTLEKIGRWTPLPAGATFLLPNAIDLNKYTPGKPTTELIDRWSLAGQRILLTLGRMDAREQAKGFDEVLEILPRMKNDFPNLRYVIAGDGSDRQRLEQKASQLGLGDSVVFTGYVNEATKLDLYRAADVFVMPSRLEGFGYVFLEALAVGLPVVASKVDGSREAVRDGKWGILVDPARSSEIEDGIRSALTNPVVPDRAELEHFSWRGFERRCHAAFDSLTTS